MENKLIFFLYTKRVFLGFVFGICYIIFSKPASLAALNLGIIFAIIGETIRLVASGYIIKTDELATYGPYSKVRHPLYLGSFIMGLGMCIALFSSKFMPHAIIFTVLYLFFFFSVYIPVLKKEEFILIEKYKEKYLNYKSQVPMLFPKIFGKKFTSQNIKEFDKKVFLNNKEYRALSGLALIILILIIKYKITVAAL